MIVTPKGFALKVVLSFQSQELVKKMVFFSFMKNFYCNKENLMQTAKKNEFEGTERMLDLEVT